MNDVAVAILAGGTGHRMGGLFKPFIEVEGIRIFDRQRAAIRALDLDAVVVVSEKTDVARLAHIDMPIVCDGRAFGSGPLAGIEAALTHFAEQGDGQDASDPLSSVICLAGDLPYLTPAILACLRDAAPVDRAVIPRVGGRLQPLIARYPVSARHVIRARLDAGENRVRDLADVLGARVLNEDVWRAIDASLRFVHNLNRPGDVQFDVSLRFELRKSLDDPKRDGREEERGAREEQKHLK
jgi:molybdopterin-guanine dinucleotide biosynthesis protein A